MKTTMKITFHSMLRCAAVACLLAAPGVSFATSAKKPAEIKQSTPQKAQATPGTRVLFNNEPALAPSGKLVDQVWKVHPDYKKFWDELQLLPNHAIGLIDLNGDKNPEIFVRHTEPNWGFCDKQGFACRTHVYAYTDKGMAEIGDFMAADPIIVLPTKKNNINSLSVPGSDDIRRVYSWSEKKRYELEK